RALTHVGAEAVVARPSVGPLFLIDLFADLVGPVTGPTPPRIIVRGTAATREPPLQIAVRDTHAGPFRAQLSTEALDNALVLLPEVGAMRFEVDTDCLRPTCEMVVKAGSIERVLPLAGLTEGRAIDLAALTVLIGRIVRRGDPPGIPVTRERLQS